MKSLIFYCFFHYSTGTYLKKEEKESQYKIILNEKKKKIIIKIGRLESDCLFFITLYFSLCKSQEDHSSRFTERKIKYKCKHVKLNAKTWLNCKKFQVALAKQTESQKVPSCKLSYKNSKLH